MNVSGFEEALEHSLQVKLKGNSKKTIPFASPAGLALLKIIAWDDRTIILRNKDAKDLSYIMRNYLDAGNNERLYDDENDLIEENFDYELAGARLLGRDVARICGPRVKSIILPILESQTGKQKIYPLAEEMMNSRTLDSHAFEKNLKLLETFKQGVKDI